MRRLASSPRSRVWVVEFDGRPAVVKQITGGTDAQRRFARELAALRLAATARPAVVPAVLAVNADARVLVLEYLPDDGPEPDWTVGYAEGLARLHASGTPGSALPVWSGPTGADVGAFLGLAGRLGLEVAPGVPVELRRLVRRLAPAGQHALLHGDPCPGNDLYTSDGVRFVDLEQASVGSGVTELAYLYIGFPTCWCVTSVPPERRAAAVARYRVTWQELTGTEVAGDVVDACAGWLIRGDALVERAHRGTVDHLDRLLRKDWRWGTVSARERLLYRLGVVAVLAREHPELAGLASLSRAMADRLRERWPRLGPPPDCRPTA